MKGCVFMKNTAIVFTDIGKAEVFDREIPTPKPDEVLLKIEYTTISSGTERANLMGDPNVSPYSPPFTAEQVKDLFPRTCGYSASGVIEAVGENVTDLKVGDRVAASWTKHQRYICMNRNNVYKIHDDNLSFSEASMVHIATFPMGAIRKCNLEIGESAAVMGLGILGLMAVQFLKAAGAAPIIAIDPLEEKRELALKLGADYVLDPFEEGFAEKVKELSGGGLRVAIEVTGNGKALDMILDCMAFFGRVALLGCTRDSNFSIDYYRKVHGKGVSLIGAHTNARPKLESCHGNYTDRDEALSVLKLMRLGRIDLKPLVAEVHSPMEAPEIFHRLATEKGFPVVQFDWSLLSLC